MSGCNTETREVSEISKGPHAENENLIVGSIPDALLNSHTDENSEAGETETFTSFHDAMPFAEEKAWVRLRDEQGKSKAYCIDTQGNVLFSIGNTFPTDGGYSGGIILVANKYILDEHGDVVFNVDESEFKLLPRAVNSPYENTFIIDGYFAVARKYDTFEKTGIESGILNRAGEWIYGPTDAPQSLQDDFLYMGDGQFILSYSGNAEDMVAFNAKTQKTYPMPGWQSYFPTDGDAFYDGNAVLDCILYTVEQGKVKEFTQMEGNVNLYNGLYREGLFFALPAGFYNLEGEKKIDLSEYNFVKWSNNAFGTFGSSNYKEMPYFVNGYSLLYIENDQGSKFFTVIDKSGNRMFEPLKGAYKGMEISSMTIKIYSEETCDFYDATNGDKLLSLETSEYSSIGHFKDGLLLVETLDGDYMYIKADGSPLEITLDRNNLRVIDFDVVLN